jgi:hypothetical protein
MLSKGWTLPVSDHESYERKVAQYTTHEGSSKWSKNDEGQVNKSLYAQLLFSLLDRVSRLIPAVSAWGISGTQRGHPS